MLIASIYIYGMIVTPVTIGFFIMPHIGVCIPFCSFKKILDEMVACHIHV